MPPTLRCGGGPLVRSISCDRILYLSGPDKVFRCFTVYGPLHEENNTDITRPSGSLPPSPPNLDPHVVHTPRAERRLLTVHKQRPVASRRRRAALASSSNIPFHQLPYQCFQEARNILRADRQEKVEQIRVQRERLERTREKQVEPQNEAQKENRLRSMTKKLDELKILADINDPLVKKNFEDGMGDMDKPIYRHLADLQWRSYKRKILMQRIEQMTVIPDVLPSIDPVVSTSLSFGRRKVAHGEIVDSRVSEIPPNIVIQPYDKGDRLVTIAVVNPDVPDVHKDGFDYRCHFLAANVKINPKETLVRLGDLVADSQVILPWLPPYSQKGLPYQRLSVFIFEQPLAEKMPLHLSDNGLLNSRLAEETIEPEAENTANTERKANATTPASIATSGRSVHLNVPAIKSSPRLGSKRDNFVLRSFVDKHMLRPVGVDLFRTQWDDGTEGVMQRAGIPGWDVEFKRMRVEPLPYKRLKGERFR